ncbi:mitochondrial fission ELM1 family protein [Phenylobacterium sp. LjRoot219]|uniref:mitochondrial fission ELM1 family protein n=1 Tax=Phenylobacterium sp. LjRoot219 TaxID=3342283 RepID=UPI003ECCB7C5
MGELQHSGLTAWALTTGEAGMRTQARGLARAVAGAVVEKVITSRPPWRKLPSGRLILRGLTADSDRIAAPWPDLIVSSGRRSALIAREARRLAGGRPLLVHVQDPRAGAGAFDLIVAMDHDRVQGANVVRVATALHDVTPAKLAAAAEQWRARLSRLRRPLIGVILGGPAGRTAFGVEEGRALLERVRAMQAASGGGVAVVPSRRTPDAVLALFAEAAEADPDLWVWGRDGDNPYLGVLALADRLVVTGDSTSMVSEALATPHPVEVFTPQLRATHQRFVAGLQARGLIRLCDGAWTEPAPRPVVDATAEAAAAVGRLLAARGLTAQRGV